MAADNTVNLLVNQKADFQATFIVKENGVAKNLTGFSVLAEYKSDFNASDTTAKSFTTSVDHAAGRITLSLAYDQTAKLVNNQKYYYDVVLINDSTAFRTRIIEGTLKASPGVSI